VSGGPDARERAAVVPTEFRPVILVNPDRNDLDHVQRRFGLHPLVVTDLLAGRQHPRFESFSDHRYLTVWDLNPRSDGSTREETDIAMVLHDDGGLLVVQRGPDEGRRDIEALLAEPGASEDGSRPAATSALSAAYRILDAVVRDFVELGAGVERDLDEVEAEVFDSSVREDYRRIYRLRQRIGRIDRAASGLATALRAGKSELEALAAAEPALRAYLVHLEHAAEGVASLASAEHSALDAVVSSHESNVATRQNQDMRTISAFAALLAIPTVVAGLYGMNFKNLPLIDWEFGWVAVGAALLVLDLAVYFAFRRRGWLGKSPANDETAPTTPSSPSSETRGDESSESHDVARKSKP
jgi:magnesium transporter